MAPLRSLFALVGLLSARVLADCVSYGVDYANGGSYYIDASSNQYFTFQTVFQGCSQDSVSPVLVGPDGNEYACSAISTMPAGQQITSTCGIPFSAMRSGSWKIILQGQQVQVQRTITLTVGLPATTTVTATPTIVLGITSTPRAVTVYSTRSQTATLILIPNTVTAACNGAPVTVTNYQGGATVTITSTIVRNAQGAARTSYYTTTVAASAACHYPSSVSNPAPTASTVYVTVPNGAFPTTPSTTFCIGNNCYQQDGKRSEAENDLSDANESAEKRDLQERAPDAVAAQTVTVTETTYTVTQTLVTSIPARTTTELVLKTITATVQPPASTVCQNGSPAGQTVTVRPAASTVTQTNIVYVTSSAANIVWVGQTQYSTYSDPAQATACWRAGGWYGA